MVRYEKGHKEATRRHIIGTASRRFRRDGIDGVGLASLMGEAGLTHGGFYNHFTSKEELVSIATSSAVDTTVDRLIEASAKLGGGMEGLLRAYLNARHRDQPENGCVIAALASDMARRPEPTRSAFSEKIVALMAIVEERLPESIPEDQRRSTAYAIYGLLVGSLQLARLISDKARSDEVLHSAANAVRQLTGEIRS